MPLFIELFMMGTDFPKPKSPLPPPSPALVISFFVLQPTLGYFPLLNPSSLVKLPRCVLALFFFFLCVKSYNLASLLCPRLCHPLRSLVHSASLLADSIKGLFQQAAALRADVCTLVPMTIICVHQGF